MRPQTYIDLFACRRCIVRLVSDYRPILSPALKYGVLMYRASSEACHRNIDLLYTRFSIPSCKYVCFQCKMLQLLSYYKQTWYKNTRLVVTWPHFLHFTNSSFIEPSETPGCTIESSLCMRSRYLTGRGSTRRAGGRVGSTVDTGKSAPRRT